MGQNVKDDCFAALCISGTLKDAPNDISMVWLFLNSVVLQWEIHYKYAYWAALRRSQLFKKIYLSHSLKYSFEYQNFVTL